MIKENGGFCVPRLAPLGVERTARGTFSQTSGFQAYRTSAKHTIVSFCHFSSRVRTRLHTTRGHASARSTARADTVGGNVLLTPRLNSSRWSNCHALRRIKPRPSAGGMQIHLIARTIRRRRRRVYRLFPANIRCPGTQALVQQSSMKTCKFVIEIYIVVMSSML